MTTRFLLFMSAIILTISLSSCNRANDTMWVYMDETACPPGWVDPDSDRKTKDYLEGFLRGNDVIPLNIKIDGDRENHCLACNCFTGRTFRVKIYKSQLWLVNPLGFYE